MNERLDSHSSRRSAVKMFMMNEMRDMNEEDWWEKKIMSAGNPCGLIRDLKSVFGDVHPCESHFPKIEK